MDPQILIKEGIRRLILYFCHIHGPPVKNICLKVLRTIGGRRTWSCSDGIAARVVLDRVDVRLVALEVLNVVARPHVPDKRHFVASLKFFIWTIDKRWQDILHFYITPKKWMKEKKRLTLWQLTPETKVFGFGPGAKSIDMTSAVCPWKLWRSWPDSTSQRAHVASPEPVNTWNSSMQQLQLQPRSKVLIQLLAYTDGWAKSDSNPYPYKFCFYSSFNFHVKLERLFHVQIVYLQCNGQA